MSNLIFISSDELPMNMKLEVGGASVDRLEVVPGAVQVGLLDHVRLDERARRLLGASGRDQGESQRRVADLRKPRHRSHASVEKFDSEIEIETLTACAAATPPCRW